jgi:hypothetical protein
MKYGKIIDSTYVKFEDERQKLRMGGISWSIKLNEITKQVKDILYITKKFKYRININTALQKGFLREFSTGGVVEEKLIVPLKFWQLESLEKND